MRIANRAFCAACLLLAMTVEALAYGGPGAAITLIGSLIGVGAAIFASLFYVIAWPLRRMWKRRKASAGADENELPGAASPEAAAPPARGH